MSSKPQQLQRNRSSLRAVRLLLALLAFQASVAAGQVVPAHPLETAAQRNAAIASTATEYARSLERSRAELEAHAKALEAELRSIRKAGKR